MAVGTYDKARRTGQSVKWLTIIESAKVAIGMLRSHKLRSFLTMLGVIIGVAAVSMIILVQNGFQSFVKGEFDELSADSIFIMYDPSRLRRGQGRGRLNSVTKADRDYLTENTTKVATITGLVSAPSQTVRFGDKEATGVQVQGIDVEYYSVVKRNLQTGRLLEQSDIDNMADVAVISTELEEALFGNKSGLGQNIVMNGISVQVVGTVLEKKQNMGPSNTKTVEMPAPTVQRKWIGGRSYTMLMARPKDGVPVKDTMDEIWEVLMKYSDNKPVYRVDSSEAILGVFNSILGTIGVILAGIAALSLLVGGIGIMNIMLVSVTERTKEIGLRMALGAKRGAIMVQFLIESGFLSLCGGLIGMFLAWCFGLLIKIMTAQMKWPNEGGLSAPFPIDAAIVAAIFSAAIGMVFGLFPAMSAARLDPIVALRKD